MSFRRRKKRNMRLNFFQNPICSRKEAATSGQLSNNLMPTLCKLEQKSSNVKNKRQTTMDS